VPGGFPSATAVTSPKCRYYASLIHQYGAYVDEGTMIDSHALVGSCAQIGKHIHLSAGTQIGGVLEPIGAMPVIVEDDVFIGATAEFSKERR